MSESYSTSWVRGIFAHYHFLPVLRSKLVYLWRANVGFIIWVAGSSLTWMKLKILFACSYLTSFFCVHCYKGAFEVVPLWYNSLSVEVWRRNHHQVAARSYGQPVSTANCLLWELRGGYTDGLDRESQERVSEAVDGLQALQSGGPFRSNEVALRRVPDEEAELPIRGDRVQVLGKLS